MAWLSPLRSVLDAAGTRWALIGALAALRYRDSPRLTTDIDLLADPTEGLTAALEAAGFEAREIGDVGEPPHMIVVRGGPVRADILLACVEYQRVALRRAKDHVLTVEDVIVHKLIAWRPRDQDDVLSILRAGHPFDESYIERWADEWEVTDRWRVALRSR
ncbi:MAG: hypothetical protein NVS3B21_23710 [Acidimicrobiales bacterium]